MIDLKTKQAFWAEQLPFFKEKYWLPNHLEVLEFDMIGGCFEIAEGVKTELSEEDILEIYHRVNSGWAMWKKAVTFMQAKAQVVPETHLLIPKDKVRDLVAELEMAFEANLHLTISDLLPLQQDLKVILETSESGAEG